MNCKIDASWTIAVPKGCGQVVRTAADDFRAFLSERYNMDLKIGEFPNLRAAERAIVICMNGTSGVRVDGLDEPESFRIEARPAGIVVCGVDERGALNGVFYLEELLNFSDYAGLEEMSVTKKPLIKYRIGTVPSMDFTRKEIRFLAASGVNCLHMFHYCWMEQLTPSSLFPEDGELIRRDEAAVAKINEIFGWARSYGMDCYLFVRGLRPSTSYGGVFEHRFTETGSSIFSKFPDVKGSNLGVLDPLAVRGHSTSRMIRTHPLCFSSPNLKNFIRETCQNLYRRIPNLKGMIVEPFDSTLWCDDTCDACRGVPLTSRLTEYITLLRDAALSVRADAQVLLYHWGFPFIRAERDRLINSMPKDVIILNAYTDGIEQFMDGELLHYGGYYDTTVNVERPGEVYLGDCAAARESGHGIVTWMTAGSSNEFKGAPYIPAPYNIAIEIFDCIRAGSIGLFEHGGPDHCIGAEVFKWAVWEPEQQVNEILEKIAVREYGTKASKKVLEAWRRVGEAANRQPVGYYYLQNLYLTALAPLFPAEDLVCFITGVQRTVHLSQLEKMLNIGVPYVQKLLKGYSLTMDGLFRGLELFREALVLSEAETYKKNIQGEINMTAACASIVKSKVHFLRFVILLMERGLTSKPWAMEEMAGIIRAEILNSKELKRLVETDKRVGYNMWEGWIFTPENLGKRILAMELHLQRLNDKGFYIEYINAWR